MMMGDEFMRGGKVVSLTLSAALVAGLVGLTGCGRNGNNNDFRTQNAKTGNRYDLNSVQNNRITGLKYSPLLSKKVSQLGQIRSAQVLVTDRDAYVAVTLHGPHGTSGAGYNAKSVAPRAGNRNGSDGLRHSIGRSGVAGSLLDAARGGTYGSAGTGGTRTYGTYGADGRGAGTSLGTDYYGGMNGGISGNSYYSYGGGNGPRSSAGTGFGYAPGIGGGGTHTTGMNGNIMNSRGMGTTTGNGTMNTNHPGQTTGNQGTTGTYGTYGTQGSFGTNGTGPLDQIPQSLKIEIEGKIKASAPHIQNVHISGHPEFVSRVSGYATQSPGGGLLRGVENDFSTLIQRIFPSRTGTMTGPSGYTPTQRNTNGIGNGPQPGNGFSGGTTR
ncbi:YhcN/YlaJ family sporulation lipoprotein [Paenibacillus sp. YPG26]|uniref:YhcN/YlaJ family sporulation lipoprotein n=1 Tax=Paenibacillus sp. YPG26 TaxID=2878915 RepID=UPI00203C87B6|nr:YhcN/YlaJ family sporulation lipoprotein [Paenibacillus sp. YPG26]USB32467.1 YhcN/YlaJ family sporulation lipoprotein [Paenibacillus sp. YPG26]